MYYGRRLLPGTPAQWAGQQALYGGQQMHAGQHHPHPAPQVPPPPGRTGVPGACPPLRRYCTPPAGPAAVNQAHLWAARELSREGGAQARITGCQKAGSAAVLQTTLPERSRRLWHRQKRPKTVPPDSAEQGRIISSSRSLDRAGSPESQVRCVTQDAQRRPAAEKKGF